MGAESIVTLDGENPWDPLPNESVENYQLFKKYCTRSYTIRQMSDELGISYNRLRNLSVKWRWMSRRDVFRAAEQAEFANEANYMIARSAEELVVGWGEVLGWVMESIRKHRESGKPLTPAMSVKALTAVTEAFRLIRGEDKPTVNLNFNNLSPERLEEIDKTLTALVLEEAADERKD